MTAEQRTMIRDLGTLALSTVVSAKYSEAARRLRELLTTVQGVARELNEA